MTQTVRIGTLSAARITPPALLAPARMLAEAEVTAVAARRRADAEAFAAEHGIPVVHGSYEELLADPEIDAVYNPLPNSLHAPWTLRALAAGKHVLCEKPFTDNVTQARQVADAARRCGLVVMEAMHYRYHPLAGLMTSRLPLLTGEAGVRHIHCRVAFPLRSKEDIRYQYELGGGATMDAGCYALDVARLLGAGEPAVTRASATLAGPDVDQFMDAFLSFADGSSAELELAFDPPDQAFRAEVRVTGWGGQMTVSNFIHPHNGYTLTTATGELTESVTADPTPAQTTYLGQLRAFAGAVLRGEPFPTTPGHAVVTMQLIDDIYRAAGLPPRPPGS